MQESAAPSPETDNALTVEDRLDIQELISEYCHYEDNGDAEAWGALYTSDGRFVGSDKEVIGHEALIAFAAKRWATKPQVHNWVHWTANVVIRGNRDVATARSFQMVVEKKDGGYIVKKTSGKDDELRRENGKWRFHVRRVFAVPFE